MTLEEEIFQHLTPDIPSLVPYGFRPKDTGWVFEAPLLNGAFRAMIEITPNGRLSGRVVDTDTEEDYIPLRLPIPVGSFAASVREAYESLLKDIAAQCFRNTAFTSEQAGRIVALSSSRYGTVPEFMDFGQEIYRGTVVLRCAETQKWYAIIMQVRWSVLTKTAPQGPENDPLVTVMNVKVGEDRMDETLSVPGVFPAYHMQKKSWVSVLLEDRIPDEIVIPWLDISYRFASSGKKMRAANK